MYRVVPIECISNKHFADSFDLTFGINNALKLVFQSRNISVYVRFMVFVSVYCSARYSPDCTLQGAQRHRMHSLREEIKKEEDSILRNLITVLTITASTRIHCDIVRLAAGRRKKKEDSRRVAPLP